MSSFTVNLVCCDATAEKRSQIVPTLLDQTTLDQRTLQIAEQELPPHEAKGLHNAAVHPEHGPVTYLQHIHEGGFSVFVGDPNHLEETFFGPGSWVAFIDAEGPGHSSKVGPDGVKRTFRMLKGHLQI